MQVRMAFPSKDADGPSKASFVGNSCSLRAGAYTCPKCLAKSAELPCQCHVCGITLISSPHLARSYHHLFPLPPFIEHRIADVGSKEPNCFACSLSFACESSLEEGLADSEDSCAYQCPSCQHMFCIMCDVFVHEHLHNCPGCECSTDVMH